MGNIFIRNCLNRALLSSVLASFTLTYAVPLSAIQPVNMAVNINDIAFMVRLEKVVERLVKSEGKGIDKIVSCLVDVKQEIESSYNIKLNTDKYVDDIYKDLNKQGHKPNKKQFETIKKKIKGEDKKHKHHARYLADVMYVDGYQMNAHDEAIMTESYELEDMNHFMMKASKKDKDDKKDDKEEVVVLPSLLVYGVTISLCGLFLMCLPIPACKDWGSKMVVAGVTACANSLCSENDKKKNDGKDGK